MRPSKCNQVLMSGVHLLVETCNPADDHEIEAEDRHPGNQHNKHAVNPELIHLAPLS